MRAMAGRHASRLGADGCALSLMDVKTKQKLLDPHDKWQGLFYAGAKGRSRLHATESDSALV